MSTSTAMTRGEVVITALTWSMTERSPAAIFEASLDATYRIQGTTVLVFAGACAAASPRTVDALVS